MSYIDREAAIERLCYVCGADCDKNLCTVKQTIEYMPDADVEPIRHGEWVVDTIYPSGVKKFHCSICGQERTVHEKYEGVFRQNYCPNCGTKMDKGET